MSMITRRVGLQAFRAPLAPVRQLRRQYASPSAADDRSKDFMKKGARRDPELYVRTSATS